MKLKFEEAISVPASKQVSVAESIDLRTIGIIFFYLLFIGSFSSLQFSVH